MPAPNFSLTPEQLAKLNQWKNEGFINDPSVTGSSWSSGLDLGNGWLVSPQLSGGGDSGLPQTFNGWQISPTYGQTQATYASRPGDSYYDASIDPATGAISGLSAHQIQNGGSTADLLSSTFKDLAPAAAMVAGGYGLSQLLAGGLGGLLSGAGSSSAGVAGLPSGDLADLMYGGGSYIDPVTGATIDGSATLGGGASLDAAGAAGAGSAAGGAAGGSAGAGTAAGGTTAGAGTGAAAAAGTAGAGTASGLLSGLGIPSGLSSLLAPLLGAAVGSQPQKTTQTNTPWAPLIPYLSGSGGLFDQTKTALANAMSPQMQAGYADMRNLGMNLMTQPVAGNGFSQFFGNSMPMTAPTGGPSSVTQRFAPSFYPH